MLPLALVRDLLRLAGQREYQGRRIVSANRSERSETQRSGDLFGCEYLTPRRALSAQPGAVSMEAGGHGSGDRARRHLRGLPSAAGAVRRGRRGFELELK